MTATPATVAKLRLPPARSHCRFRLLTWNLRSLRKPTRSFSNWSRTERDRITPSPGSPARKGTPPERISSLVRNKQREPSGGLYEAADGNHDRDPSMGTHFPPGDSWPVVRRVCRADRSSQPGAGRATAPDQYARGLPAD